MLCIKVEMYLNKDESIETAYTLYIIRVLEMGNFIY